MTGPPAAVLRREKSGAGVASPTTAKADSSTLDEAGNQMPPYNTPRVSGSPNERARALHLPAHSARAYAGPPCRGRSMWALVVLRCALCGGMHTHRAADAGMLFSGLTVRRCPVTGNRYRLSPIERRLEAVRRAA